MLSSSSLHGYLVHIYTASTLIFVALGIQWVLNGKFRLALIAMIITILIDATDGMLARKFRVKETAASVDGAYLVLAVIERHAAFHNIDQAAKYGIQL